MVYVRWPRDNGMPADSEFPALSAMEDRLTSSMAEAFDAVFCGRITTAGRREFYFYASRSGNAEDVVKDALRDFREYEFECGSKPDPAWTQYLDVLFPSAEDQQSMKNRKVLDVLQQKGDSLSAPRNLRHWIYFATEADRAGFRSAVSSLEYRVEFEPFSQDSERPFGLCVARFQSIKPSDVDEAVIELFRLADSYHGEYDGWETELITGNPPAGSQ